MNAIRIETSSTTSGLLATYHAARVASSASTAVGSGGGVSLCTTSRGSVLIATSRSRGSSRILLDRFIPATALIRVVPRKRQLGFPESARYQVLYSLPATDDKTPSYNRR